MNIKYGPHGIKVIDGFLTPKQVDNIRDNYNAMKFGSASNQAFDQDKKHWKHNIVGPKDGKDEKDDLQNTQEFIDSGIYGLWTDLKLIGGERQLMRAYFNGYTYGTEGYFHQDRGRECSENQISETYLIYCNREWDYNWGGETVFAKELGDVDFAALPKKNRVVLFDGSIHHAARSVSRICNKVRKILTFKTMRFNADEIKCVDYVRKLTTGIPHSGADFFTHLFGTYNILARMGFSQDVRLAGLFHAIYGTAFFKGADLKVSREEVRAMIGPYAEELAHTFGAMENRTERLVHKLDNFHYVKGFHLAAIEYANLLEQLPRFKEKEKTETALKRISEHLERIHP
jgi:hypothetical protein